ncbi:MAG: S8 family serine peptidase [Candidatus Lokiarchaeota archaeon]|nr:S8 family serine peptidase [Candidatus Lokiarchaeota archaeon]
MKRSTKLFIVLIIIIGLTTGSNFFLDLFTANKGTFFSPFQKEKVENLHISNNNEEAVIVFFNKSTYDMNAANRFEYYGGHLKENEDWNGIFNNFSGFAGVIPFENISSFKDEFPDINIDNDEIIEAQMNYASVQVQSVNSTWYTNGYNGDTGSSIAVLDSGVNPSQDFLQGTLSGWQNFVDQEPISDNNGHGTFISSVIAGTGSLNNNSGEPSIVNLYGNYSHLDLFNDYLPSQNYTFKIFTANMSKANSRVMINATVNFNLYEIDHFWFELYNNTNLVNSTSIQIPNQYYSIVHNISPSTTGIYDLFVKYHKKGNTIPSFSFNSSVQFYPESYLENFNHFTGIANATKILAYKIVNQSGIGYVSDLISAMGSVIQNRTVYQIVSVCLSVGALGDDVTAVNAVIDEVIENHILVVIAAGNNGIESSKPLNSLGTNKNAIVVGAINDKDQVTSYSSMGREVGSNLFKPDIVAPGGSTIPNYRSIISADSKSNEATVSAGTSISTAIVSAVINILIDAKWGTWSEWNNQDLSEWVKTIKAILLMTASETNMEREDDPQTDKDESDYSPSLFNGLLNSLKDEHEGYGRLNVQAAIDALTKKIEVDTTISSYLTSSEINPLGDHVFARKITLQEDVQYLFELSDVDMSADLDLFLFSNESNRFGEPILLEAGQKWYGDFNYLYFTPKSNQTNCIIIVKAIEGNSSFNVNVTSVLNDFVPELKVPEITYFGGSKNSTVISLQEYYGNDPAKNYTIDSYWFYINYFDNDSSNVAPQEIYVSIVETAKNYSLSQLFAFDNNYTNGAIFRSDLVKFHVPGTYHYFFTASDGFHQTRYPMSGELNITIEFPSDSEPFPYVHDFNEGYNGWTYNGTGWGLLNQSNQNDNRSSLYAGDWTALYFGREHDYPSNYTYQPYLITNPFPNGSLRSPLFNITQINKNTTQIIAKFGLRISINSGDYIFLQINLNWTGWITLEIYTDEERDWFLEEINITQYIGNYVQFRLLAVVDDVYDPVQYKGLMLDYFMLENYTNSYSPEIDFDINKDLSATQGFKYDSFTFSCRYYDSDGNYPEYVYIEIEDTNYSMINIFGAWNATFNSITGQGIKFVKSFILDRFTNLSFRFHTFDGRFLNSTQFYNQDNSLFNFEIPSYFEFNVNYSSMLIGYEFSNDDLSNYYIVGTPSQKELTPWLMGDNSWHEFSRFNQNYLYGGLGNSFGSLNQGYGIDWEAQLITHLLYVPDDYDVYLRYSYDISLQNEFFLEQDELDKCVVSISNNYGEDWVDLKEYFFDSETLSGNESLDISQYSNGFILIRFTLYSNNITLGLGNGWLLSNIYVGYDKSTDFVSPLIEVISPSNEEIVNSFTVIEAIISDNIELDSSRIYVYLNNKIVDVSLPYFNEETGVLMFNWDTTLYTDGQYQITLVAYDIEGNRAESSVSVIVENGLIDMRIWGPWLLVIIGVIIIGIVSYFIAEKKNKLWFKKSKTINAEKIRLNHIDKEQIIKRIELIESHEDQDKPIVLHCKYCGAWFESDKFNYYCPVCEHDQIFVAYNCISCGKWYFKDEPSNEFYCKNKRCKGVRLVKRDKEEVQNILSKEGIFLRKYEPKKRKFSILDS